MKSAVVVRGRLNDARHIELEESLDNFQGDVDVVVLQIRPPAGQEKEDIREFIARIQPGLKSKQEIDRQIREERSSWDNR